jgi:hypothetical protein
MGRICSKEWADEECAYDICGEAGKDETNRKTIT